MLSRVLHDRYPAKTTYHHRLQHIKATTGDCHCINCCARAIGVCPETAPPGTSLGYNCWPSRRPWRRSQCHPGLRQYVWYVPKGENPQTRWAPNPNGECPNKVTGTEVCLSKVCGTVTVIHALVSGPIRNPLPLSYPGVRAIARNLIDILSMVHLCAPIHRGMLARACCPIEYRCVLPKHCSSTLSATANVWHLPRKGRRRPSPCLLDYGKHTAHLQYMDMFRAVSLS